MPRLSYTELFEVYQSGDSEDSPERWVLAASDLAARVTELDAKGWATYNIDPRYPKTVTYVGRCDYNAKVTGPRASVLLVSQATGYQYLVVAVREGERRRGGNPALVLSLSRQNPPVTNLRRT